MNYIQTQPYSMLINGQWKAGSDESTFSVLNPATQTELATVYSATEQDVDAAVMAAHQAYITHWKNTTPKERAKCLRKLGELFEQYIEKLAWIETLNVGKPITHSRASLKAMPDNLDYFAGIIPAVRGETIPVSTKNVINMTIRESLGVCVLIMPWNYPMTLTINKLAPALAAGNTVVIKPSEVTPLSTVVLAELFEEAGFPPGVINVVNGSGAQVGDALVRHPYVARVSFTGGTKTGSYIQAAAAEQIKPVTLELGGKSPLIVFEDGDIDAAVEVAAGDLIKNSGQVCIACTRLLLQDSIQEEFVEKLQQRMSRVLIGDPTLEATEMGPLVNATQYEKVLGFIERAQSEGATPLQCSSEIKPEIPGKGFFVSPTLMLNSRTDMESVRDEIFGPVQSVLSFADEKETIEIANDTRYGLAAVMFTRDGGRALRIASELQTGSVAINTGLRTSVDAPFGGYKQSGIGKERGLEAIYENTQLKNIKYNLTL
ncbi:aldehyde dehydrogenase family protein [Orrella sp. 11846]|uniref:aldehyde dehydrogenase family protein n=1 Tax=Orrella sp. 11846 TaxID=3409913 RepID=UPI003B5C3C59